MGVYKNILLAVDIHPSYDEHTTERAVELAKENNANLFILNAVKTVAAYGATQGYDVILEVEGKIREEAKKSLSELAQKYGIPLDHQIIEMGPPEIVIVEQAKKNKADLIIVGGHSPHRLHLIFGSTVDGVSHHAPCDVLSIKAKE